MRISSPFKKLFCKDLYSNHSLIRSFTESIHSFPLHGAKQVLGEGISGHSKDYPALTARSSQVSTLVLNPGLRRQGLGF